MTTYRVAVIAGDGIGNEVTPAAIEALDACAAAAGFDVQRQPFPWGSAHYFEHGRMMPEDALDRLRPFDAIFFGAVGDPRIQDNITLNGLLLPIRRAFDQYACVRPAVLYPGVRCPLAGKQPGDIDFVVVRENTEGEYAQVGGVLYSGGPHEVAVQSSMFTRHGTERVIRFAFELARRRGRKRLLTSVTKSNAQGFSMAFWDRVFAEVAGEYPDIRTESLLVDAACMDLVRRPETFDVMVASNLFGDILTDLSAAITGSLGLAPSANLNPERTFPSMFEPVHGSAPDIAGRGVANPMAAMLAGAMMLEFLGQPKAAAALEKAVLGVLKEAETLTPDLGGRATTREVTDAVLARL
jgi:tartrate dehydrogenase/decarboxylase / D-malate dehydrogenase